MQFCMISNIGFSGALDLTYFWNLDRSPNELTDEGA